jgi:hypothetical protein
LSLRTRGAASGDHCLHQNVSFAAELHLGSLSPRLMLMWCVTGGRSCSACGLWET